MSTVSGCLVRSSAMTAGQNSASGSGPVRPPQVLAKTWLVISIAMSQRIPSHWSAMSVSVLAVAARRAGENASSCTTSGHGGKYGSRPRATIPPAVRRNAPGAEASSSSVPRRKQSGRSTSQG